ncbi:MAG TPA: DUF5915 domain-containing protein, partial [Solirubrobacteraceae bacterium]|nr:DUF5915 domain-containing protein [Solirubrobacteraceae bacterium]
AAAGDAAAGGAAGDAAAGGAANDLDRWVRSRLAATADVVSSSLDAYDATSAGRCIGAFVDELSNWYVRRSRRRFWDGDPDAFATLRECLVTVAGLLAPFTPFVADEIYDNLDGALASVHLTDFPDAQALGGRDEELEFAMSVARETVRLGLAARGQAQIKTRQPLRAAVVVASPRERTAIGRLAEVVREELNVRELRFVSAAEELGRYEIKPNYRSLGPRFGPAMPQVAAAVAALDAGQVAAALRDGHPVGIAIDGREHRLEADDVTLALAPLEGYGLEREGSHAVALELEIDDDLRQEGLAREIVHAVQNARKAAGLNVEDRITLTLDGDPGLLEAARAHAGYLAAETLALSIDYGATPQASVTGIEGSELLIGLRRVQA